MHLLLTAVLSVAATLLVVGFLKWLTPAQAFSLGVVLVGLWIAFWLIFTRRWFRVKAIILLALAPVSIPGFTIMAKQFGVTIAIGNYGPWAAVLAIVGICVLGLLEAHSNRRMIVGATLDAFVKYFESLEHNDPPSLRKKLIGEFEQQPDVDKSIFRMCAVLELTYSSKDALTDKPGPAANS